MPLPIQRCLDNCAGNIYHCASNVPVENRSTIDRIRDSIDMVFKQRPVFRYSMDPSGTVYNIGLTISSKKNGYPSKRNIMIGPPNRGC